MNNLQKIVSGHCVPLEGMRVFFLKKAFHEGTTFLGKKINCEEVVLNTRTIGPIMPKFGGRFINGKCIFQ